MRHALLVALVLAVLSPLIMGGSCNQHIVRDRTVFEAETNLAEQMALQPAEMLQVFLLRECTCDAGVWTTPECVEVAKLILTVVTRAPYHKAMALYNAGITDDRPPETPPEIPTPETLCP